jgi:S1/P1 nuclease
MLRPRAHLSLALLVLLHARIAAAWGPEGHRTVAAIADKLLAGSHAAHKAHEILGSTTLVDAAVWADCAKAVTPPPPAFTYHSDPQKAPECAPFETAAGEAEMVDFVKRNTTNCNPKPGEETCHKQYHYTDISIRHETYKPTDVGARDDDITAAITAAVAVLQGGAPAAPFSIKNKREALRLLIHYVGDIHQPLHVGAVYLDAGGKIVNPDAGHLDPATDTRGGNQIIVTATQTKLHKTWDDVPAALAPASVDAKWLGEARAVAPTQGPLAHWSTTWASETQKQARKAFAGVQFGAKSDQVWGATLPNGYSQSMSAIKRAQLTRAGARLAQLLAAIWP